MRLWRRESIVRFLFFLGMAIAFLGSMSPWFFWPLGDKFVIPASICLLGSIGVANVLYAGKTQEGAFYSRTGFILPLAAYIVLSVWQLFVQGKTVNAYVVKVFSVIAFFAIFRVRPREIQQFCDFLAKGMGGFMVLSMSFFLLYLLGFPLPGRDANYIDLYSFTNYYFFLIDDRNLFTIIPRFQSIFVEPGHLGTMTALLLFTQFGKWRRWYNVSLLIATFISFSLAAYGILVPAIFLSLWIKGRQVLKKGLYAVVILASITTASFFYNDGDNLLHDLIMIRLEIEDGELAGDNRVSDNFKADYESLLQSSDVLTGRERDKDVFGNSGYRVFIYDYGLIGLALLIIFYVTTMYDPRHKKEFISVLIIAALNFIIRGNILQFSIFISLYQIAKNSLESKQRINLPNNVQ